VKKPHRWFALSIFVLSPLAPGVAGGSLSFRRMSAGVDAIAWMQSINSPIFGAVVDHYGYTPICVRASVMPLAAVAILKWMDSRR
jgi:hypothetical protein